jgi:hypothetical protein
MSQDYIAIAQRLRAQAERRAKIRRREIIILSLFGVFTIFFALIG